MITLNFLSLVKCLSLLSWISGASCFITNDVVRTRNKSMKINHGFVSEYVYSHESNTLCMGRKSEDDQDEEHDDEEDFGPQSINVLGTPLKCCCENVGGSGIGTGFYRNGFCSTGTDDIGRHTVCIEATTDFLEFSQQVGNDLSTPVPQYMFPGLKEGDIWCLCAQRWAQAYNAGMAPKLFLQSTHEKTLTYVPLEILRKFAVDGDEADQVLDSLNDQRAKLNNLFEE